MPTHSVGARSILLLATLAAVGNAGCGLFGESSATLKELELTQVDITVLLQGDPRVDLLLVPPSDVCESIHEDVEAHVNGKDMAMFARGGEQPSRKGWVCSPPQFRRTLSSDELGDATTRVEVSDETASIVVASAHLLEARTVSPKDGNSQVKPGQEISFMWSEPSDELVESSLVVDLDYDDPALDLTGDVAAEVDGGTMRLRMPASAPIGKGVLRIEAQALTEASTCEGAPSCVIRVKASITSPIEVLDADSP